MPDGFDTRETWPFECLRCLYVWEENFVVRHLCDAHGNEVDIWLSSGIPVQPPWSGACCPDCGAYHVTWFPAGYLTRHPEFVAAPEPEPERVPVPVKVPAQRRAPSAGRLLIALGVPLAAFVGFELYANLVAVARPHP